MTMPIGFDFQPRTRVVFGAGAVDRLGELTRTIGTSAFLVTDPGLVAAGPPWPECRGTERHDFR